MGPSPISLQEFALMQKSVLFDDDDVRYPCFKSGDY